MISIILLHNNFVIYAYTTLKNLVFYRKIVKNSKFDKILGFEVEDTSKL